jgi:hypothetical protein
MRVNQHGARAMMSPVPSGRGQRKTQTRALLILAAVALLTFAALAVSKGVLNTPVKGRGGEANLSAPPPSQIQVQALNPLHATLALEPEADKLRRRLGRRFLAPGREVSDLVGTLTVDADRQPVRVIRSQGERGERVVITLGGGQPALVWTDDGGALSGISRATGNTRALVERLALDSPDQFIYAQLRGAAYYTVASQVRPSEAGGGSNYAGPVWDLVRVGEPPNYTANAPLSSWRQYYLNSATGLIEKIVSQENGQTVSAEVSGWVEHAGETIPTQIVWKKDGRVVMELTVNNAGFGPRL